MNDKIFDAFDKMMTIRDRKFEKDLFDNNITLYKYYIDILVLYWRYLINKE